MTDFQLWIIQIKEEYAGGNKRELGRLLGLRDSAVHAWEIGRNGVSKQSCILLELLTHVPAPEIAQMAKARWKFEPGYAAGVSLPSKEQPAAILETIVADPVYPKCDQCNEYKFDGSDRARYYCMPLALAGLPVLCEAHSAMDEMIITLMLEDDD
jgi:hypothetical protein